MEGRELRIPSRHGTLEGMEWGRPDGIRMLALHGWQDNLLSLVPLVQTISSHLIHIVAFDYCGHGRSSHLPKGQPYDVIFHYILCVLEVVDWLKWDKFSIIGHSLGALIGIKFAALFPNRVENLITLDILYPDVKAKTFEEMSLSQGISMYLKLESKEFDYNNQPSYTWEQAIEAHSKFRGNLSRKNIELLLQRNTRPSKTKEGMFEFTRDHRTNTGNWFKYDIMKPENFLKEFSKFTGNWLAIVNNSEKLVMGIVRSSSKITEAHTLNCKSFQVVVVNTKTHYFHMENPELVTPHIVKLLQNNNLLKNVM